MKLYSAYYRLIRFFDMARVAIFFITTTFDSKKLLTI